MNSSLGPNMRQAPVVPLLHLMGVTLLVLSAVPLGYWFSQTYLSQSATAHFGYHLFERLGFQPAHCSLNSTLNDEASCDSSEVLDPEVETVVFKLEAMGYTSSEGFDVRQYAQALIEAERIYQVPHEILIGVAAVESAFNPQAQSIKNARGLYQLLPNTASFLWPEFSKTLDIADSAQKMGPVLALSDVRVSTLLGAYYISYLQKMFQGRTHLALASYNAGPKAVHRALQDGHMVSSDYVLKVFAITQDYRKL